MKHYLFQIAFLLITIISFGQNGSDAIQYSQENLNGTARFRAMGGAFGALGGDFSSLNVNPAGSAIFNNNQASLTLSSYNVTNNSNYFGTKTTENDNTFDLNQLAGVWIFNDYSETSDWKKIALAVNYENTNSFNNAIFSRGINPNNNITDYFISYANGVPLSTITNNNFESLNYRQQQSYLGYEGYLINPVAGSTNNEYESSLSATGNYLQENNILSTGYNGKLSFNASAAYKDKLFLGLNLNSHFSDYTRSTTFYEDYDNATNNDPATGVQRVYFSNDLYTYGTGFSFQVGAIAKLTNEFRVGLSYESPTWYNLNDELQQTLFVDCADCPTNQNPFYADPEIKIIYPTYRLQTPSKYTGSFAYIFGKKGLFSIDYTMKDYSNMQFKPQSDYSQVNNNIANTFDRTNELRVGAEYRIKQWSLRGGYRFEESPYKNKQTIGDLNNYTTGLGYNFGDTKLDIAYSMARRNYQQSFFEQGLTDYAIINSRRDNVSLTLVFEL